MPWIDASWTAMAAACLTLASIHLLVWNNQRSDKAHLAFAIAAVSVAVTGCFELLMMHADSAKQYAVLLRWAHVPFALLVPSLVAFVRLHLGVGRAWLGHLAWGLRVATLIPNFTTGVNLNFVDITGLIARDTWGGASFVTPVGVPNPWMGLGQLSSYLLLAFFLDAAVTAWRKPGNPSRAKVIRICLSMVLFILLATMWHLVVVVGSMQLPVAILPAFTGVLLVMSYELGRDVVRAGQLTKDLTAAEGVLLSERKLADAQFRTVVESAPTAMIVAGMDGRIRFANRRAEEDFGWSRDELGAMTIDQLVPEQSLQAARHDEARGIQLFGVRRGGQTFQIEVTSKQIELGGAPAVLVSVSDISERKRMERESTIQRDELAHLSRVSLLAELSGSLAHELNQPLTSILSNAQAALRFLARDPSNQLEIRQCLDNIIHSDKLAGDVIRRLRRLLRKEPADFESIDLDDVIRDVLRVVHSDLLIKGVDVRLKLHEKLPLTDGDRVQLQQVLLNLIVNGSDAMQDRPHGRELTITSKEGGHDGVEVVVSDVGHGIPAADLERIFSPFVTSKPEGMGLGLAVCRTIIEAHRGRLWATNNADTGASLHFWLPVSEVVAQDIPARSRRADGGGVP